ncbi:MAG: NADPH-dependent reductase [Ilumatobacteraceae bacterium]|nr:NADPH-dependent reductase [Ilumatobacteraceae bacterium]
MRIVGICGSLQSASGNLTLLRSLGAAMPAGVEWSIFDGLRHLPMFDPDLERDGSAPAPVAELRAVIGAADALVIASPEYGHSLPGSLKNAIDWLIGSGELEGKVFAVTASVVHTARGRQGLDALLRTLAAVSARVVGGVPIARGAGEQDEVDALVAALVEAASAPDRSTVAP